MRAGLWMLNALLAGALSLGAAHAEPASTEDDPLLRLQARIESSAVLRGDFVQRKTLHGFNHPLLSSGTFLVARDAGVVWDTQEPFASVLVIGTHGIRMDGVEQIGGEQPGVARINRLLVAAIAGELPTLRGGFAIESDLGDDAWSLRLIPNDAAMAQVIVAIEMSGDRHVEHVTLFDSDGNRTDIELSAHNALPPELTPEEASRFD